MKEKAVFSILFGMFFLGLCSAIPYILFVNPTPLDNYETTSNSFEINSSINDLSNLEEFIFGWDDMNYTFYNNSLVLMMNFENKSRLGENSSFVRDLSKYQNNGTIFGAIFNPVGKYGGAYNFSGRDKITIANSDSLNITDNLTISLWAKRNNILVKQISVGGLHTCILTEKGDAYCWGFNQYGQLGIGNTINSLYPKLVLGGHNFTSISCGSSYFSAEDKYTCGIDSGGNAYCWGENSYGQLGIGNTTQMSTPQLVLGGNNFTSISAGYENTCTLNTTGSAYCWGENSYGQLGIGNTTQMSTPQLVLGGNNFTSISAGYEHTCGFNTTGSAYCWGRNNYGQLGIGNESYFNMTNMYTPQLVLGGNNFTSISAGYEHNCALNTTGSAYCWGRNNYGQLGSVISNISIPLLALGGHNFTSISTGFGHTCALDITGNIYCCGDNSYGQLGVEDTLVRSTFQLVLGGHHFTSISSKAYFNCGKTDGNEVYCWGENSYGQLGIGSIDTLYPKPILGGHHFTFISGGDYHTCALNTTGSVYCWGLNWYGELGIGNNTNIHTSQLVLGGNNFTSMSTGYYHTCALNTTGSAYCWGHNSGCLGNGNYTNMNTPQLVLGRHNFTSISASYGYTCALNTTGSAYCWGYNADGELGDGNTTSMNVPQLVLGGHNFTSISSGGSHTCALNTTGSAYCWGNNTYDQLGIGNNTSMNTSQLVLGEHNFTSISSGFYHTCALNTTGSAYCWGNNEFGALGNGNYTNMNTPQLVLGEHNFTSISSGFYHTCALNTTGSAYCWGINNYGELGNGNITNMNTPQLVSRGYNFTFIYAAISHTCALNTTGSAYCWGYNNYGQLGNGKTAILSPIYKTIKSVLIGKSMNSFLIGETFGGTIVGILNQNPIEFGTLSGWTNVLLSYNKIANLYLNSALVNSSASIQIDSDPSEIVIGENFDGIIDEVRIFNRTFSSLEAQQAYKSNLKKINETSWEFYSIQSLDFDKNYSYSIFIKDLDLFYSLLRNIIKYSLPGETHHGGGSTTRELTDNRLIEANYSGTLIEGQEVQINLSNGENYTAKIEDVSVEEGNVIINVNGKNYSISINETKKIDLNNDDYYDLEVSVMQIYNMFYTKMTFNKINEKVFAEEKSNEVIDNNASIVNDNLEDKNGIKWYYFTVGFFILLILLILTIWIVKEIRIRRLF